MRMSPVSGREHTMTVDATREEYRAWLDGTVIQEAMPRLTPDQREFLMTGITPDEWASIHMEDDE
jgi:hypothetical protein